MVIQTSLFLLTYYMYFKKFLNVFLLYFSKCVVNTSLQWARQKFPTYLRDLGSLFLKKSKTFFYPKIKQCFPKSITKAIYSNWRMDMRISKIIFDHNDLIRRNIIVCLWARLRLNENSIRSNIFTFSVSSYLDIWT